MKKPTAKQHFLRILAKGLTWAQEGGPPEGPPAASILVVAHLHGDACLWHAAFLSAAVKGVVRVTGFLAR